MRSSKLRTRKNVKYSLNTVCLNKKQIKIVVATTLLVALCWN